MGEEKSSSVCEKISFFLFLSSSEPITAPNGARLGCQINTFAYYIVRDERDGSGERNETLFIYFPSLALCSMQLERINIHIHNAHPSRQPVEETERVIETSSMEKRDEMRDEE